MCTDDDISHAVLCCFDGFGLLLRRAEPGNHIDANRESSESLRKCLKVLGSQNGCWAEDCHLTTLCRHLEGCAHRNLGLTKSNISTNQTIHGLWSLQILNDVLYSLQLIIRFDIRKRIFHFPQPWIFIGIRRPFAGLTRRIELYKIASDFLRLTLRFSGCLEPLGTTELVHRWCVAFASDVLLQPVNLICGNIQLVVAIVLDKQKLTFCTLNRNLG